MRFFFFSQTNFLVASIANRDERAGDGFIEVEFWNCEGTTLDKVLDESSEVQGANC